MASFSRYEVALGRHLDFQEQTGKRLCKATLIEGKFWYPHFCAAGTTWTHLVTFDEVEIEHLSREIGRTNKNAHSQHRRVDDLNDGIEQRYKKMMQA
jgi:hypothetical protein